MEQEKLPKKKVEELIPRQFHSNNTLFDSERGRSKYNLNYNYQTFAYVLHCFLSNYSSSCINICIPPILRLLIRKTALRGSASWVETKVAANLFEIKNNYSQFSPKKGDDSNFFPMIENNKVDRPKSALTERKATKRKRIRWILFIGTNQSTKE